MSSVCVSPTYHPKSSISCRPAVPPSAGALRYSLSQTEQAAAALAAEPGVAVAAVRQAARAAERRSLATELSWRRSSADSGPRQLADRPAIGAQYCAPATEAARWPFTSRRERRATAGRA